jgi:hypothetical protein
MEKEHPFHKGVGGVEGTLQEGDIEKQKSVRWP